MGEGDFTCSSSGVDDVFDALEGRRGFVIAIERGQVGLVISAADDAGSA